MSTPSTPEGALGYCSLVAVKRFVLDLADLNVRIEQSGRPSGPRCLHDPWLSGWANLLVTGLEKTGSDGPEDEASDMRRIRHAAV